MSILYIDDDKEDAEIFCEMVGEIDSSIHCTVITDARKGLKSLVSPCPDFIFFDYRPPLMDGMEILRQILENIRFSMSRIILYSTYMNDREIAECRKLGVFECLKKSGHYPTMLNDIRTILYPG